MARNSITSIADATKCLAKMRAGKACTMQEAKATAMLLGTALDTARRGGRMVKSQLNDSKMLVQSLLSRIGL
jgi:hypothetical protein